MTTWIFLLSAVLLYADIVEGDFGMKVETNETVSTPSPSTDSGDSPNMMMIVVPDDEVEVQKAALTAVISQGDNDDLISSTLTTVTENTSGQFDISLENDKTEERKTNDPVDEVNSSTATSGWDQIGFNRFDQLRGEPPASTYFESNRIEPSQNTQKNYQLELQQDFSENKYINKDYTQIFKHIPIRPTFTQPTQGFDDSLNKKNLLYEHERIEQNRLYQIEAAKAYIKQIAFEQEYAQRYKSLQEKYIGHPQYPRPSAHGTGSLYLPPTSTSSAVPNTQSPGLIITGVHSIYNGLRSPFIHNDYDYDSGTRSWNKPQNQLNEPNRQFGSVGNNYQWSSSHNNLEGDQDQWKGPFSQSNKNHWNTFSHQLQPKIQADHGVSLYSGPTASPVVLPSGYLEETEEVKKAKDIHLRAIGGATRSYWRDEQQLTKPWS